jgi:hypothetical protein
LVYPPTLYEEGPDGWIYVFNATADSPLTLGAKVTSYSYDITSVSLPACSLSLTVSGANDTVVYRSLKHETCSKPAQQLLIAPKGSFALQSTWNGKDDSGRPVKPGNYTIMYTVLFSGGGNDYNFTDRLPMEVTSQPGAAASQGAQFSSLQLLAYGTEGAAALFLVAALVLVLRSHARTGSGQ